MIKHYELKSWVSRDSTESFVKALWPQSQKYWNCVSGKSREIGQKSRNNSWNLSKKGVSHQSVPLGSQSSSLQKKETNPAWTPSLWSNERTEWLWISSDSRMIFNKLYFFIVTLFPLLRPTHSVALLLEERQAPNCGVGKCFTLLLFELEPCETAF